MNSPEQIAILSALTVRGPEFWARVGVVRITGHGVSTDLPLTVGWRHPTVEEATEAAVTAGLIPDVFDPGGRVHPRHWAGGMDAVCGRAACRKGLYPCDKHLHGRPRTRSALLAWAALGPARIALVEGLAASGGVTWSALDRIEFGLCALSPGYAPWAEGLPLGVVLLKGARSVGVEPRDEWAHVAVPYFWPGRQEWMPPPAQP